MDAIMEDNGLMDFIDTDFPQPETTEAQLIDAWKKNVAKARRILLEVIQDHIVASIHGKATPYTIVGGLDRSISD